MSMLFACLVVVMAYISRSKDSEVFIRRPLQTILDKLLQLMKNPLDITVNASHIDKTSRPEEIEQLEGEH